MTSLPKIVVELVKQWAWPLLVTVATVTICLAVVRGSCTKEDPTPSSYELRIEPDGSFEIVVPQ